MYCTNGIKFKLKHEHSCKFLYFSIDAVFEGPTVIPTSEDTMDEMVEACRHIDDIRGSGRIKRSLNITVPGNNPANV